MRRGTGRGADRDGCAARCDRWGSCDPARGMRQRRSCRQVASCRERGRSRIGARPLAACGREARFGARILGGLRSAAAAQRVALPTLRLLVRLVGLGLGASPSPSPRPTRDPKPAAPPRVAGALTLTLALALALTLTLTLTLPLNARASSSRRSLSSRALLHSAWAWVVPG